MLTALAKILSVLNSEVSPWQIGWGLGLGLLAGLLPFGFLTLIIVLVVCLFTVNLSIFFLVWGVSGGLMLVFADALEAYTWQHAQAPALLRVLAESEFLQLLHLHHTLVLGALVLGLVLLLPVTWLGAFLVKQYRAHWMTRVNQWRVVQVVKASKLYQLYSSFS